MLEMKLAAGAKRSDRAAGIPVSARGFTLIELLVTFAVLAVMLVLAAPSFIAFQRSSELTTMANSFLSSLTVARAEATKRQLNAFVEAGSPTPSGAAATSWSNGWFAYVDVDNSHSYTAGDILLSQTGALPTSVEVNVTADAGAFVDSSAGVNRPYVMFNGSGFRRTLGGAFVTDDVLEMLNVVGREIRCIEASPSGRVRVFRPSAGAHCAVDTLPAGG